MKANSGLPGGSTFQLASAREPNVKDRPELRRAQPEFWELALV
jgi:hypothetical protein